MAGELMVSDKDQELVRITTDQACELAEKAVVDSDDTFVQAGIVLKKIKGAQQIVESTKSSIFDPLDVAIKRLKALFKAPELRLERAEELVEGRMLAFQEAQKEKARAEQARLDAIAAKERQKKEQQAAVAAQKAREAAATGDFAKAETLQAKADLLADTSASIVAPMTTIGVPRIAGVVPRETWSSATTDIKMLVLAVAAEILRDMPEEEIGRHLKRFARAPIQCLKDDRTFLNTQARAFKIRGQIYPGVFGVVTRGIAVKGE